MRTSRISSRTLVWLLLAVGLGSCDFLSTEPKSELTTANFFTTADQAIQATNATYSMLRVWEVHVFLWIGMTDIASDDATKGSTPGDAANIQGALDNLTWDAGNEAFRATWTGYYQGIYRANEAIQGIPGVPMDATLRARLVGENEFLRAYYYFFLARAYGGVPLITHPLEPSEYRQSRASRDAIYDLIVQDLSDASATLPRKSQYAAADLGRATKGAAQAMLAQVYLYRKDYAHALAYADSVITSGEYSLYPDYSGIFTQAGENSSESVFEVQAAMTPGGGCQPNEGCTNVQYAEVQGVRGTPNIGWGFNTPSADLEAAYEPGDPRLEATILYPWKLIPDGSGRVVYLNPQMVENNRFNQKVHVQRRHQHPAHPLRRRPTRGGRSRLPPGKRNQGEDVPEPGARARPRHSGGDARVYARAAGRVDRRQRARAGAGNKPRVRALRQPERQRLRGGAADLQRRLRRH